MNKTAEQTSPFSLSLQKLFASQEPSSLQIKAFEILQKVGLPHRGDEGCTYLPLSFLYKNELISSQASTPFERQALDPYIYPECKDNYLVFVDGVYRPDISSPREGTEGFFILPYEIAMKGTYRPFLQKKEQERLLAEKDPFALINLSLSKDGLFLYASPSTQIDGTLQLLLIASTPGVLSLPKVHIALGSCASLKVISRYVTLSGSECSMQNTFIDASLEEGAHLEHTLVADSQPDAALDFFSLRASLKKKSTLACFNLSYGSSLSRQGYRIALCGPEADAKLLGLTLLEDRRQAHTHVVMDHHAPACTSDQFFKTVVSDVSQSSFTGKILVKKEAQKTVSYQLNNNLILSEGSIANSKPGLEILADDVKASHGATFCQLDEEELFYLRSRGLSLDMARALLLKGFCKQIIDQLPLPSLQRQHSERIDMTSSL